MAAPAPAVRVTPPGIAMKDGYQSLVTFEDHEDIEFWEKIVQAPGIDGGDPIDTTTMHNTRWRVFRSRALFTLTEFDLTVAYDPVLYDSILLLCNLETTVTILFSNNDTLAFYGYLVRFDGDDMSEGEQPEGTITVQPTNWDPVNGVEEDPVLTQAA